MKQKSKKPTPEELLVEVQGLSAARTYEFEDYLPVIHALQQKGNSYADIAKFIQDRLGITASRGQVYRAYQIWLDEARQAAEAELENQFMPEPPSEEDEYRERLHENATRLIQELREADQLNAPWDDPHSILQEAVDILDRQQAAAKAADEAAATADAELEAKKGKKNAPAK